MPKVLVTGGTGFLGSHLVEALAARGEEVRALVRSSSDKTHLESLGVELVYGDLNDLQSLKAAAQGADCIYHCAALAADWGSREIFHVAKLPVSVTCWTRLWKPV